MSRIDYFCRIMSAFLANGEKVTCAYVYQRKTLYYGVRKSFGVPSSESGQFVSFFIFFSLLWIHPTVSFLSLFLTRVVFVCRKFLFSCLHRRSGQCLGWIVLSLRESGAKRPVSLCVVCFYGTKPKDFLGTKKLGFQYRTRRIQRRRTYLHS